MSNPQSQLDSDAALARQLQEQERQQVIMASPVDPSFSASVVQGHRVGEAGMPTVAVQGNVVQGSVVQGNAVAGQAPAYQESTPVVGQALPYQYGLGTPHLYPIPITVESVLPHAELIVLRYRFSMTCFASIDAFFTLSLAVSSLFDLRRRHDTSDPEMSFGFDAKVDSKTIGVVALIFMIGPACGLLGARRLDRRLVAVYLVFCVAKMIWETTLAVTTMTWWRLLLALIEMWITKIVFTFWSALRKISAERCKELLDPNVQTGPISMVYW